MRKRQKLEIDPDLIRKPDEKGKGKVPKMRLSSAAIQRLEDQAESSYEMGDKQFAIDLRMLLKFYRDATMCKCQPKGCGPCTCSTGNPV